MPTYRKLLEVISNMSAEQLDQPITIRVDGEYWLAVTVRVEDGVPIPTVETVEDSD